MINYDFLFCFCSINDKILNFSPIFHFKIFETSIRNSIHCFKHCLSSNYTLSNTIYFAICPTISSTTYIIAHTTPAVPCSKLISFGESFWRFAGRASRAQKDETKLRGYHNLEVLRCVTSVRAFLLGPRRYAAHEED